MTATWMSPPQLAERYGIRPDKIIRWIRRGELEAVDVSDRAGSGRPRYRISPEAIERFEQGRTPKPRTTKRRKRKASDPNWVSYYS